MSQIKSIKGFTLVELAVSMVVIGILLGLGMSMVGPLMTSIKVRESRENLGASVESINSYASGNNRLPDTTLLSSVVRSPQDAWGQDFIYLYDANLYAATPTKDTICGRRSTGITLRQCLTDNCATTVGVDYIDIPNVAYVMLSKGDDSTTETELNGTLNSGAINGIVTGSGTATGTIKLDAKVSDIARWVTLDELRTKIGCQGAQLKIVNNELPFGAVPNAYSVKIYADGGVPWNTNKYKWCVNTLPVGFSAPVGGVTKVNCLAENENDWGATPESELTLSFVANASGLVSNSHLITVVVRDNAENGNSAACNAANPGDNCASKVFVLTINPN